ncbi:PP2C family protein-serine/threonine phosphatase [Aquihabitans daechungensis]|uniref:PP2C family protein-serine/threonine phosphatase n=1 Tax=Aquihabitans daechungensis TaxID=1052257 RepID=UPI003B9E7EA8
MTDFDDTFEAVAAGLRDLSGSELQALLAAATHVARNAVCITDADLDDPGPRIVYVNPAFERMTGYSANEVQGRNPRFLQGPATDRRVLDRLRTDLETGRSFQGETVNYRKDGTPFTMAWRIAAVRDQDGQVTHYVAAQDDLSALRGTQQLLRSLADRLQGALLPTLPEFEHVEVAGRCRPVFDHALVGGDWFDAVALDDGSVAVLLGDSSGHDDEAAALMGELRFTCRGLLRGFTDPGELLDELDRAILNGRVAGTALATVVVAVIDRNGAVRYAVAGHPAPVIRRASGSVDVLDGARSRLIGASTGTGPRPTAAAHLEPGDVLVAFSDGAFERRGEHFDAGYDRLVARLLAAPAHPVDQCIAALSAPTTTGDTGEAPIDDLSAVAVRRRV